MSTPNDSPSPDSSFPLAESSPPPPTPLHHICSKCITRLYDSTAIRRIPCGEVLCEGCVLELLRNSGPKCPRCNVPFTHLGVSRVFIDYVETPEDRAIQVAVAENEGTLILEEELAILQRRYATLENYEASLMNTNKENATVLSGIVEHILEKQKWNQQTGNIVRSAIKELETARNSARALDAEIRDAHAETQLLNQQVQFKKQKLGRGVERRHEGGTK